MDETASNIPPALDTPPNGIKSKRKLVIIGVILLLVIIASIFILGTSSRKKQSDTAQQSNTMLPVNKQQSGSQKSVSDTQAKAYTLIYGFWSGENSIINSLDLASNKVSELATLPSNIKKVSITADQTLIYINQTDAKDHGKSIVVYDLKTKTIKATIPASEGFGIDEYVLSPDKKYIALWEVSFAPNANVLQGGRSRVYAVALAQPTKKNRLYDEVATAPINYPKAILNNGTVFTDTFLPNDPNGGAGWAYGMSVTNFDGSNKQVLTQMQNGTYGTQPSLSPDGKMLVFAGYDGTLGDGKALKNGYRQALLTPNTIELLDTTTLTRTKLSNLPNSNSYTSVNWDTVTNSIITSVISTQIGETGLYTYDLAAKTMRKINLPKSQTTKNAFISLLSPDHILAGVRDDSDASLGNLGDGYAPSLNQLYILDAKSTKPSILPIQEPVVQHIALLPFNYFKNVQGITTRAQVNPQPTTIDLYSDKNASKDNLQLYTFLFKSDLAPVRVTQQTATTASPTTTQDTQRRRCREIAAEQCKARGIQERTKEFDDCEDTLKDQLKADPHRTCYDSPLYLYGTPGQHVAITIQTPISNAIPASSGTYNVLLGENGNFSIDGKSYRSIAYDYVSNLRTIAAPTKGTVVTKTDVEKVLRDYARRLGLNEKETSDLVTAGKASITAPYAFISFFDQKTSEQILPIAFSPKPDNYLNVVFYFKNLISPLSYTPAAPDFPAPVKRNGFTAVEVSEMAE